MSKTIWTGTRPERMIKELLPNAEVGVLALQPNVICFRVMVEGFIMDSEFDEKSAREMAELRLCAGVLKQLKGNP